MEAKGKKKRHRILRVILKVLGAILSVITVAVVILAIRNHILNKSDRKLYTDAYGEYYTSEFGDRINYTFYDSNSDRVAVILPGYGAASTHYEFDTLAKRINADYKLIIVDPIGVGLSDVTDTERTVENYCTELHGLMEHLGYDKYTIIGHSIAGLYSLYYANEYADEVEAFIGIDASVPHQVDSDEWMAKPENQYKVYKLLRALFVKTGIYRVTTELGMNALMDEIPTLTEEDRDKVCAMYCTVPMNDSQMQEMKLLGESIEKCRDMRFPETVPVLYVLSNDNCERMAQWEQLHKDIVTHPKSKVVKIDGTHYLHHTNLDGLLEEIKNWEYR
ncbi:MAG: alpha/beta hydrolase [Ruminococcus sp.]|uniref:alpha/beta fold hydrolase n=1 Tax=Ruminococcus sp. TaxID=41978 RepID=UPI001B2B5BC3|nr:alpha/beta hydrolase [Ruminococcus sp.]MBO7475110.1 alpha/beta hydrolase [Ruminococcus sp.]